MTDDTLDPPGLIAVLGGGPIGIEAALYGRYLGYAVVLFEADRLVRSLLSDPDRTVPEVHTSPLGLAAVAAQRGLGRTSAELQLETFADWAHGYFERIAESDLLVGRLRTSTTVQRLELAPPEEEDSAEPESTEPESAELEDGEPQDGPVPPDFLVHFVDSAGVAGVERVEAVIDARGAKATWIGPGEEAAEANQPYLYRIGSRAAAETDFHQGLVQIRQLYAALWGRPGLDVYANLGGQI